MYKCLRSSTNVIMVLTNVTVGLHISRLMYFTCAIDRCGLSIFRPMYFTCTIGLYGQGMFRMNAVLAYWSEASINMCLYNIIYIMSNVTGTVLRKWSNS